METKVSKSIVRGIERSITLAKVLGRDVPIVALYRGLLKYLDKIEVSQGKLQAIKLWKYWFNCVTRKVMQEANTERPPTFMRMNKSGFPTLLTPFMKEIDRSDDLRKRLILTAFRSYELATVVPVEDLSTILDDSEGPQNFELIRADFRKFLVLHPFSQMLKKDFNEILGKMKGKERKIPFHYTVKQGVSGSSLGTAGLQSLFFEGKEDMIELLNRFSSHFFYEALRPILEQNIEFYSDKDFDITKPKDIEKIKKYAGRITFIPDKGGKTRCVAIGNYWIQNALNPLHKVMFNVLRKISTDGTYDQISQSSRVARATELGPVWSYDLTAATDRIPLNIQICIVDFLNKEIGQDWGEILNSVNFCFKVREYKYKVGQPMGLYSSWASLALTHHLIIQYCAYKVGSDRAFLDYAVLGDDVAIWDKQVAEKYEEFITYLGIEISKAKSYIPKGNDSPWKAEFAKRIYLNGKELSGISPNVLKEGLSNFWSFPELCTFLVRHGLPEIVNAPVSRITAALRLSEREQQLLLCAFRLNEVLGAPHRCDELPSDIKDRLSVYTPITLMRERIELLAESFFDLMSDLDREEEEREELENLLNGEEFPEKIVVRRIIDTRIKEILDLESRLMKYIPSDGDEIDEAWLNKVRNKDESEYEDNIITKIKDIEFLPSVRFSNLMEGVTLHKTRKQYRILYLKRLTLRILRNNPT